jgi:hypothetical protein
MNIKAHIEKHKVAYSFAAGAALAGITAVIMRDVISQPISRGPAVTAQGGNVAVLGKRAVMSNVSFVSANRPGPPSWIVRCLETNEYFSSQKKAALTMGIPQSELSQHLNGLRDTVRGRTFERICLAA